jgi:hypothetical protein
LFLLLLLQYEEAKSTLQLLEQDHYEINKYFINGAGFDWGPGEMFLPLAGRWVLTPMIWYDL